MSDKKSSSELAFVVQRRYVAEIRLINSNGMNYSLRWMKIEETRVAHQFIYTIL